MEIEELAKTNPDAILFETVNPVDGLTLEQARTLAQKLGLEGNARESVTVIAQGIAKAYLGSDATLLEINPLGITADGKAVAMDAKMTLDDNALFRHPEAKEWQDPAEENPLDVRAAKAGVNYVALEGSIGCLVNGAGLAMATMDIIKYAGGMPANFLDVGGGANAEQVTHAFEILLSDKSVKAVLINIFGGILRVDTLATGVVEAARKTQIQLPIVLRLEGTNVEAGREILKQSGLNFIVAETMKDAAEKVVAAASAA